MHPPFYMFTLSMYTRTHTHQSQELSTIVGLCYSKNRFIWLSILFVYKGILLIIGIFLAFETRKVKIRHLNDSKVIGIAVYCIVVLSIVLSATGVLLENYVDVYYAVLGIMILLGNSSLLCLIFIPRVSVCVVAVWCSGCVLGSGPEVPEFKPHSGNFPSSFPSASHQSTQL